MLVVELLEHFSEGRDPDLLGDRMDQQRQAGAHSQQLLLLGQLEALGPGLGQGLG